MPVTRTNLTPQPTKTVTQGEESFSNSEEAQLKGSAG